MKIAYLRVSTKDQDVDRQIHGLKGICDELHVEKISATRKTRPVFRHVIQKLRSGDTFIIWDLDRAFRSALEALHEAEKLMGRGVKLQVATMPLDISTPMGKLIYTNLAAYAEFEHGMTSKRTRETLATKRKNGKRLGRPPKLTSKQIKYAKNQIDSLEASTRELARKFGVAPWTLTRAIRRYS